MIRIHYEPLTAVGHAVVCNCYCYVEWLQWTVISEHVWPYFKYHTVSHSGSLWKKWRAFQPSKDFSHFYCILLLFVGCCCCCWLLVTTLSRQDVISTAQLPVSSVRDAVILLQAPGSGQGQQLQSEELREIVAELIAAYSEPELQRSPGWRWIWLGGWGEFWGSNWKDDCFVWRCWIEVPKDVGNMICF